MKVISVNGEAGCGKNTVSSIIESHLQGNVQVITLGDLVRDKIKFAGGTANRITQKFVGNYFRQAYGEEVWVEKAISCSSKDIDYLILVGCYNSQEVQYISRFGGVSFWVDAGKKVRLERVRKRSDGSRDALAHSQPQQFKEIIDNEYNPEELESHGVNLSLVKSVCSHHIQNNSNIDELDKKVRKIIDGVTTTTNIQPKNVLKLKPSLGSNFTKPPSWSDTEDELILLEKKRFFAEHIFQLGCENYPAESDWTLKNLIKFIHTPTLQGITGNQTAKKVVDILLVSDPLEALSKLRQLIPSNQEEEYFSLLDDDEFQSLHISIHLRWLNERDSALEQVENNKDNIKFNDKYQFDTNKDRGLERLLSQGVEVSITPEAIPHIQELIKNPVMEHIPLLEFIKNEKIFEVSGFKNSKVSLAIHDVLDHLWTFALADKIGLFQKYENLFDSIGNPQSTDMFKREGEAIASISFGVRAFRGTSPYFQPVISTKQIIAHLRTLRGDLLPRHTESLHIVNNICSNGPEWKSLAYTFSNYMTELDEQRRKAGAIKIKNVKKGVIEGELDPYSPDYICFFIELHHALLQAKNKHRNALFATHYVLEEYLRHVGSSDHPESVNLAITPSSLDPGTLSYDASLVSKELCTWLFKNYGFSTNRDLLRR